MFKDIEIHKEGWALIFAVVAIVSITVYTLLGGFGYGKVTSRGTPEWKCAIEQQNVVVYDEFSKRSFCIDPKNNKFIGELTDEPDTDTQ